MTLTHRRTYPCVHANPFRLPHTTLLNMDDHFAAMDVAEIREHYWGEDKNDSYDLETQQALGKHAKDISRQLQDKKRYSRSLHAAKSRRRAREQHKTAANQGHRSGKVLQLLMSYNLITMALNHNGD